jgi:hypothetical protein
MSDDNTAGFTVKEMLVRVEAKVDVILADHEQRLRSLEEEKNQEKGSDSSMNRISSKWLSWAAILVAAASVATNFLH